MLNISSFFKIPHAVLLTAPLPPVRILGANFFHSKNRGCVTWRKNISEFLSTKIPRAVFTPLSYLHTYGVLLDIIWWIIIANENISVENWWFDLPACKIFSLPPSQRKWVGWGAAAARHQKKLRLRDFYLKSLEPFKLFVALKRHLDTPFPRWEQEGCRILMQKIEVAWIFLKTLQHCKTKY